MRHGASLLASLEGMSRTAYNMAVELSNNSRSGLTTRFLAKKLEVPAEEIEYLLDVNHRLFFTDLTKIKLVPEGYGAVRRIPTTYEIRGMSETITSRDDATVGSGNAVNEVQFTYNEFGQATPDYQAHGGPVKTSTTPKVQYGYASGSANTIRPTAITYPNGRVMTYGYGSTDSMSDALSRIASGDPSTAASTGDSGDIKIVAHQITIEAGSRLLAQVEEGSPFEPGLIQLQVDVGTFALPLIPQVSLQEISISIGGGEEERGMRDVVKAVAPFS